MNQLLKVPLFDIILYVLVYWVSIILNLLYYLWVHFCILLPNERLKSILLQVFEHYLLLLLLINLKVTFIIIVDFHENVVLIWTIYAQSNICFSFDHTHIRHVTLPSRRGMVVPSIFRLNLAFQLSSSVVLLESLILCCRVHFIHICQCI